MTTSPQESRTLLSILADLNNVIVLTVSNRPVISKSFSPCTNLLLTVLRTPITFGIIITFIFHSFFQFPSQVEVLIPLFIFYQLDSFIRQDNNVHNSASSLFFFVDNYKVWSFGRDLVIRLYLKTLLEFVRLILQNRCWFIIIISLLTVFHTSGS